MAEIEIHHPEDDLGQVRTKDLGRSEPRPVQVILFLVKPDAQSVAHPAAAALPLVGAGPGDRPDRKAVDARPGEVLGDPGQARVDDVLDAGDRQGRFGHVGGHDDLRSGDGINPSLPGPRQAGEQGQNRESGIALALEDFAGFQDVLLRRHEDKDVAGRLAPQEVVDGGRGRVDVIGVLLFVRRRRPVFDADGIHPAADLEHGRAVEGGREFFEIEGGRGDHHLKIGTLGQEGLENPQEEVDVQAPLVGLVDDDRVVFTEAAVGLFQPAAFVFTTLIRVSRFVLEVDFVADGPADGSPISAIRLAIVTAAIRRGWVTAIRPRDPRPASRHIFGIWVLFPQPVSPEMMTTRFLRIAWTRSPRRREIGSSGGYLHFNRTGGAPASSVMARLPAVDRSWAFILARGRGGVNQETQCQFPCFRPDESLSSSI